jgi:molecular chaperone GrpE
MSLSKNIHRIPVRRITAEEKEEKEPALLEENNSETKMVENQVETAESATESDSVDWRAQTARLQLELERCYQRQEQRIETHVNEREAEFLQSFLNVVDNLQQALAHLRRDDALVAGVRSTYRGMLNLLRQHGVEPIQAEGQPFDPFLHEAEGFVPAPPDQNVPSKVREVTRQGYRRGNRVLRPARVIVSRRVDTAA